MKKKADLPTLAGKHIRSLELGKRAYKRSDASLEAILKVMKPGDVVTLKGGKKFELVDEFATRTTVFKPCGVRRYKLEEIAEP